jgi:predicted chitinase
MIGFIMRLFNLLDCEMWARVISLAGGLLTPEVLACYRQSDANESGRLWRTAENLRDHDRLSRIFAERYPSFDPEKARGHQLARALQMAALYEAKNDPEAARASWNYWKENASWMLRLRRQAGVWKRNFF